MKIIWWGWKKWWKRPVWLTRGIKVAPDLREFGIGPISFVWFAPVPTLAPLGCGEPDEEY